MQVHEWKHWHPVWFSKDLKKKPVSVKCLSTEIVLFRDHTGMVHALKNECPHRRMRLSAGKIEGDRIICPYHGWKIHSGGTCVPVSTGVETTHSQGLEATEFREVIWVREQNPQTKFPDFQTEEYKLIHIQKTSVKAPLEIVLDNFTETEHTSSVHAFLGFAEKELGNVEIRLETDEQSVRLFNKGRQKPIPWVIRKFLKLDADDYFIDDWTTYFSPVHTVYDQYWVSAREGKERNDKLKIYVFFTPIDSLNTGLFIYTYMKYNLVGNFGLNIFVKPAMTFLVEKEVALDKNMLEQIRNYDTSLKGAKLTRFDKALGPNRSRIGKIYRGIQKEESA
jgi:phenylpropionate dioxygenase-like ring-hydroxylating dioxygenase large terminal subunit